MANCAARTLLKNGKSIPQLLGSRLVGLPRPSSNVVNKHQLQFLAQPLISQDSTQQQQYLYLQRPALGDGFNFLDFVLGNEESREGKMRLASRLDEEEDDDGEFDHVDDEDDDEDDEDDEPSDDCGNHYSSGDEYYNCCNDDEDDDTD